MPKYISERGSRLLTEQRRQIISSLIQDKGLVTTDELVVELGVSPQTVWRDLTALEQEGKARRLRGGAARLETDPETEPFYKNKQILNKEKKSSIARYAAERFVADNDLIILEAGTTVGGMVKYLTQRNLTVITNGLGTINELDLRLPNVTAICCGGLLRDVGHTFVGPQAEAFFCNLHARRLFLSATGLVFPEGITDPNLLEIQVKRAMANSAGQIILLLDSTKFGVRSLSPILPLEKINILVTDSAAPQEYLEKFRRMNIEVHVTP